MLDFNSRGGGFEPHRSLENDPLLYPLLSTGATQEYRPFMTENLLTMTWLRLPFVLRRRFCC